MKAGTQNQRAPLKLIIIGGGYAGMAALITLRNQSSDSQIILIDPRSYHLIITRLHETVHGSLDKIQIPYHLLAERFNFVHKQQTIAFDDQLLRTWNNEKCIQLDDESLSFDYLLIATGTSVSQSVNAQNIYDLNAISVNCFAPALEQFIAATDSEENIINIVGAGPTGIQFAFEISNVLLGCRKSFRLNLIEGSDAILSAFPEAIGSYVENRMSEKHITLLKCQYYKGLQGHDIVLENSHSGEKTLQRSDLTLLLLGNKPKLLLHANCSGQVLLDQTVLTHIFTAGDCSHYDEMGSNLMTSQNALRKGKAVAKNILLEAGLLRFCLPYMHQDIGYILSLGSGDAIGWIGCKNTIISGLPAVLAKETIETQYDFLLRGVDSYVL